jgi:hypothetical protein
MGLSVRGYGIHGTNVPSSIGKAASHGCIRMAKADLEELYPQVAVGDTVELIGQRNEETAQLFGGAGMPPVGAAQPAALLANANPAPAPAAHTVAEAVADAAAASTTTPAKSGAAPASGLAVAAGAL